MVDQQTKPLFKKDTKEVLLIIFFLLGVISCIRFYNVDQNHKQCMDKALQASNAIGGSGFYSDLKAACDNKYSFWNI